MKKMLFLFHFIVGTSLVVLFCTPCIAQEQVTFHDAFRYSPQGEVLHLIETDSSLIYLLEDSGRFIVELNSQHESDTLFNLNEPLIGSPIGTASNNHFYYEIYEDRIISYNLKDATSWEIEKPDELHLFHKTIAFDEYLIFRSFLDPEGYVLSPDGTIHEFSDITSFFSISEGIGLGIMIENDQNKVVKYDIEDESIEVLLTSMEFSRYSEIRSLDGGILSLDRDLYLWSDTSQELTQLFRIPEDFRFQRAEYHNDYLVILSLSDSQIRVDISNNSFSTSNTFIYENPAGKDIRFAKLFVKDSDTLYVLFDGVYQASASSPVLNKVVDIAAADVHYDDDHIMFVRGSVLVDIDPNTLLQTVRDTFIYPKLSTTVPFGFRSVNFYDQTLHILSYQEVYFSEGKGEKLEPQLFTDITCRTEEIGNLFQMGDQVVYTYNDDLFKIDPDELTLIGNIKWGKYYQIDEKVYITGDSVWVLEEDGNDVDLRLLYADRALRINYDNNQMLSFVGSDGQGYYCSSEKPGLNIIQGWEDLVEPELIRFYRYDIIEDAFLIEADSMDTKYYYIYNTISDQLIPIASGSGVNFTVFANGSMHVEVIGQADVIYAYDHSLKKIESIPYDDGGVSYSSSLDAFEDRLVLIAIDEFNDFTLIVKDFDLSEKDVSSELNEQSLDNFIQKDGLLYFNGKSNDDIWTSWSYELSEDRLTELSFIPDGYRFLNTELVEDSRYFLLIDLNFKLSFWAYDEEENTIEYVSEESRSGDIFNSPSTFDSERLLKLDIKLQNGSLMVMNPESLGNELYLLDADGNYNLLFDLYEGPSSTFFRDSYTYENDDFVVKNEALYFVGQDECGYQLYRYDIADILASVDGLSGVDNSLIVYPNPTTNSVRLLDGYKKGEGILKYELINSTGQCVSRGVVKDNKIDLSSLTDGCYYLQVFDDSNRFTTKVIKVGSGN